MNKYRHWYDQLMNRAKSREAPRHGERHHIWPRSLGGTNAPSNLVKLTYREHFLAHWLLTKFTSGNQRIKMLHALHAMRRPLKGRVVAGWQYAVARGAQLAALRGVKRSALTRQRMSAASAGKPKSAEHVRKMKAKVVSEETKQKLRAIGLGKHPSEETRQKMRDRRASPETRQKMSLAAKGKKKSEIHKQRIREANRGLKRTPYTIERIRAAALARHVKRRLSTAARHQEEVIHV